MKKALNLILILTIYTLSNATINSNLLLKKPMGVRAIGMGNAFVSMDNDPIAIHWNPAGLATIMEMTLSSSYNNQLDIGLKNNYLIYIHPLKTKKGVIGFGYFDSELDGITILGNSPNTSTYTKDSQRILNLACAYKANERFLIGFNLKSFSESVGGINADVWEGDAGIIYKGKRYIDLAFAISDFLPTNLSWSTGKSENIPVSIKTGIRYRSPNNTFQAELDLENIQNEDTIIRIGSEYNMNKYISLRGGYEIRDEGGDFSFGLSLKYENWKFDYAFQDNDFGNSNLISATIVFDPPRKKSYKRSEKLMISKLDTIKKSIREEEKKKKIIHSTLDEVIQKYKRSTYTYNKQPKDESIKAKTIKNISEEAKKHYELGNVYLLRKMYNKAIEEYLKVIEIEPLFTKAHFNLAAIYQKIDMTEKAIYQYRYILKLEPKNLNALLALGNLYYNKGNTEKAIIYYNKIIIIAPNSIQADVARKRLANM